MGDLKLNSQEDSLICDLIVAVHEQDVNILGKGSEERQDCFHAALEALIQSGIFFTETQI